MYVCIYVCCITGGILGEEEGEGVFEGDGRTLGEADGTGPVMLTKTVLDPVVVQPTVFTMFIIDGLPEQSRLLKKMLAVTFPEGRS